MGLTIIEIVAGAILAILTTIWVELLRKPKLELRIVQPTDVEYTEPRPAKKARFVGVELVNKPLGPWARWLMREAALQCHGTITFHHLDDGQNVFGRTMPIRWSRSPELVPLHFIVEDKLVVITNPSQFTLTPTMDIYPGGSERLDVAARFDDENECYGWSNESYISDPRWRNPKWKLEPGRYLVKITIDSAGEKYSRIFRLINTTAQNDFRLEKPQAKDLVAS